MPAAIALTASVGPAAQVPAEQCPLPVTGLEGLWRGVGSAADSAGAGRDAVAHGGVSYLPGGHGEGFVLDGTSGYLTVPESDFNALYPQGGSFSVSAWVKSSALTMQTIAAKYEWAATARAKRSRTTSCISTTAWPAPIFRTATTPSARCRARALWPTANSLTWHSCET